MSDLTELSASDARRAARIRRPAGRRRHARASRSHPAARGRLQRLSDGRSPSRPSNGPRALDAHRAAGHTLGPLHGVADRAQGQPLHARRADDRVVADPRALRSAVHRHVRCATRSRRRHHPRQDESRRVRHGVVHRELGASGRRAIRTRPIARRADRAAAPPLRSRRALRPRRSAPIPADRFASPRR